MRQLLFSCCIAGAVALSSCTPAQSVRPIDRIYSRATSGQDLQAIGAAGELSNKQLVALHSYLLNAPLANVHQPLAGLTYRQLFKNAERFNPADYATPPDSMGMPPPFVKPD